MTVIDVPVRNTVADTGFTGKLSLPKVLIEDETHVKVYAGIIELSLGADYSVSGVLDPNGPVVTIYDPAAHRPTHDWTILFSPPLDQPADLSLGGSFGLAYENAIDGLARRFQSVAERLNRALSLAVNYTGDPLALPPAEPGRSFKWNETGTGLVNTSSDPDSYVIDARAAAAAALDYRNTTKIYRDEVLALADEIDTLAGISPELLALYAIRTDITTVAGINVDVVNVSQHMGSVLAVEANATNINTVAADLSGANTIGTVAGIATDVSTVASISMAVTGVYGNTANINAVADELVNIAVIGPIADQIDTLASISGDVTTVASVAPAVVSVSAISSDVSALGPIAAHVSTVAGIAANVTTVAGVSSDVTTLAPLSTQIQALGDIPDDISTVAGMSGPIADIVAIHSDIVAVNANATNITIVAGINADVTAVSEVSGPVATLAPIRDDIVTASSKAADISTVASISDDVTAVAGNTSNINAAVANEANINAAPQAAIDAAAARDKADEWSNNPVDVEVEPGKYSAYHWSEKAKSAAHGSSDTVENMSDVEGLSVTDALNTIKTLLSAIYTKTEIDTLFAALPVITVSDQPPSGGKDGDIWFIVEP